MINQEKRKFQIVKTICLHHGLKRECDWKSTIVFLTNAEHTKDLKAKG